MSTPDEPRDPWLRTALRHAPDDGGPSDAVTAAILRASQEEVTPAPAKGRRTRGPLQWPFTWRPAWPSQLTAGAAASVLLATAGGLLWWDDPLPTGPSSEPFDVATAPAPVVRAPETSAERPPKQREERPAERPAADAAAPVQKAAPPAAAPQRAPARSPLPPMTSEPAPVPPAPAQAVPPLPAPAPRTMARTAPSAADLQAGSRGESQAPDLAAAAAPAPEAAQRESTAGPPDLSSLRRTLAAEPGRWTWRRRGQPEQPVSPALLEWLAMLEATAAPAWESGGTALVDAGLLEVLRDGVPQHRWTVAGGQVHWHAVGHPPQARPLTEEEARRRNAAREALR